MRPTSSRAGARMRAQEGNHSFGLTVLASQRLSGLREAVVDGCARCRHGPDLGRGGGGGWRAETPHDVASKTNRAARLDGFRRCRRGRCVGDPQRGWVALQVLWG